MPNQYPTGAEFQAYVTARGYGSLTLDEATRLVGVAVQRWEAAVGVRPYLSTALTRTYLFPVETIEDGAVLDLSDLPLLSLTSVRIGSSLGTWTRTLVESSDFVRFPLNGPVCTSLRFLTSGDRFVEIQGSFGASANVPDDVFDAVLCLASAFAVENAQGPVGGYKRIQQGSVTVEYATPSTADRLRARFDEFARNRRLI